MKLPNWFAKQDDKAPPDPRMQLEAAQRAHREAASRVDAARARLQTERTQEAQTALRDAKTELEDLGELVRIAETDLEREEALREAAARADLERQRDELTRQLGDKAEATAHERREIEAFLAVAEARMGRVGYLERRNALQRQLYDVQVSLVGEQAAKFVSESLRPSPVAIAEGLVAHRDRLAPDDPRRDVLNEFVSVLAPGVRGVV